MAKKAFKRILRPATASERTRHAAVRAQVMQEFPPAADSGRKASPPGIPARIRAAREAQQLTWQALAQLAGLPSARVVRAIEYGQDTPLSQLHAVAKALGLRLELVEESV